MGRWKRLLLLIVIGAIASSLVWRRTHEQPVYKGRVLEEWLNGVSYDGTSAETAVREIGSDAIPCVTRWIRKGSQEWHPETVLGKPWAKYLPQFLEREFSKLDSVAQNYRSSVITWISYADDGVAPLLPHLSRLLHDHSQKRQQFAAEALACAGTNGLPILIRTLEDTDHPAHMMAMFYVWKMGPKAANAVPALLSCMSDPQVAPYVLDVLPTLGVERRPYIIALLSSLTSSDPKLRRTATTLLPLEKGTKEELAQFLAAAKPLLSDPDVSVRMAATNACQSLEWKVSTP